MGMNRLWLWSCSLLVLGATACGAPPEDPQYITDPQGRALILHGLNVANTAKYDIFTVIDMHQDVYGTTMSDGRPTTVGNGHPA